MLTYEDILYAVTNVISNNFTCDVFVENLEGAFKNEDETLENECFYVSIIPVSSKTNTLQTSEEKLLISIKYFGSGSKIKNYQIAHELKLLFNLNIKINDRSLNISNIEPNFLTDEVGPMLDFLITLKYFDEINITKENYENMQDMNLNIKTRGD